MATFKKYKKKNGDERWLVKAYLWIDDVTGSEVHVTKRGFTSKQEAKKYLSKAQYSFDRGVLETSGNITFGAVYDRWLPLYKETVKESSLQATVTDFNLHILPVFSQIPLSKITPLKCQDFASDLQKDFVRYKEIYNRAKRIYSYALKIGLVRGDNPFSRVILPKAKPSTHKATWLSVDELGDLLKAFEEVGDKKWYIFFRLIAYTGMRRVEALALRWKDLDLIMGTVTIKSTITTGLNNKEYLSDTPKSKAGIRTLDLDPDTLDILRDWKNTSHKIVGIKGFVFPDQKGGWTHLSKPNSVLKRVIKKYHLKDISIHSLRHTHCSMLFESGWTLKEVQERIGHDDASTTLNIYNHVTKNQKQKSLKKFIEYVKNA